MKKKPTKKEEPKVEEPVEEPTVEEPVEEPKIEIPDFQELSDIEMSNALIELAQNPYLWSAINRYNKWREDVVTWGLKSTDPFKDPTSMARYQGILTGLGDLVQFIELEVKRRNGETEEEIEAQSPQL